MSRWYELLIEGHEEALESILEREGGHAIQGSELPLRPESFSERIREVFGTKPHHLLFAPAGDARRLVDALAGRSDLRLERLREVAGGRFSFAAKAYSRDVARAIKGALHEALPAGISLEDFQESETVEPDAKGVELYTPVHDYVYGVSGRVHGSLPGLFEMHRRLEDLDFCEPEEIEIEAREVETIQV